VASVAELLLIKCSILRAGSRGIKLAETWEGLKSGLFGFQHLIGQSVVGCCSSSAVSFVRVPVVSDWQKLGEGIKGG